LLKKSNSLFQNCTS